MMDIFLFVSLNSNWMLELASLERKELKFSLNIFKGMHLDRLQCRSLTPKRSLGFGLDNICRMVTSSTNFFHSTIFVHVL